MPNRSVSHRFPVLPLILPLMVFVLITPVVATAQCPVSMVYCIGETSSGEEEFNESASSAEPTLSVSYNASSAVYDLVNGSLSAIVNVDDVYRHRSGAIAVDLFELHNVPAALLKVRLNLSLFLVTDPSGRMAWADAYVRLTAGGQTIEAWSVGPGIVPFIELEISALEGEPFEVVYEAMSVASGYYPSASLGCWLEFTDLPVGAEITSCNGFGTGPVPVEPSTWGKVKALYR